MGRSEACARADKTCPRPRPRRPLPWAGFSRKPRARGEWARSSRGGAQAMQYTVAAGHVGAAALQREGRPQAPRGGLHRGGLLLRVAGGAALAKACHKPPTAAHTPPLPTTCAVVRSWGSSCPLVSPSRPTAPRTMPTAPPSSTQPPAGRRWRGLRWRTAWQSYMASACTDGTAAPRAQPTAEARSQAISTTWTRHAGATTSGALGVRLGVRLPPPQPCPPSRWRRPLLASHVVHRSPPAPASSLTVGRTSKPRTYCPNLPKPFTSDDCACDLALRNFARAVNKREARCCLLCIWCSETKRVTAALAISNAMSARI